MILKFKLYIPRDKGSIRNRSCWTCMYLRADTKDLICSKPTTDMFVYTPIVSHCRGYVYLNATKKLKKSS